MGLGGEGGGEGSWKGARFRTGSGSVETLQIRRKNMDPTTIKSLMSLRCRQNLSLMTVLSCSNFRVFVDYADLVSA